MGIGGICKTAVITVSKDCSIKETAKLMEQKI